MPGVVILSPVVHPTRTWCLLEYEVIWGHIDILVVAVRRLSRRWKVKTLLAGPTSPMKAEITISPIYNSVHRRLWFTPRAGRFCKVRIETGFLVT